MNNIIVFEGCDCLGKTTQAKTLLAALQKEETVSASLIKSIFKPNSGFFDSDWVYHKFPNYSSISGEIIKSILSKERKKLSDNAMVLLDWENKRTDNIWIGKLNKNLILDRSMLSSYCYNNTCNPELLRNLHEIWIAMSEYYVPKNLIYFIFLPSKGYYHSEKYTKLLLQRGNSFGDIWKKQEELENIVENYSKCMAKRDSTPFILGFKVNRVDIIPIQVMDDSYNFLSIEEIQKTLRDYLKTYEDSM